MSTCKSILGAAVAGAMLLGPAPVRAQGADSVFAVSYGGQSLFRVNQNGGIVAQGTFVGDAATDIPVEGSGTRMLWFPGKGAIRAGGINGTQWDNANVGLYSTAFGENVRALGNNSLAVGLRATAANVGTVAIGEDVTATGANSVVLGQKASSSTGAGSPRLGTFVFGDRSTTADTIHAEVTNSATWRVANGFRIYTAANLTTGVTIQNGSTSSNWGQSNAVISTSTGAYLHTNGTWTNNSDVGRKHRFQPVAGEDVLARLRSLPITTWTYRVEEDGIRHMGPTAQDFHATFGLGDDDRTIGTVDADGVALAAAQALEARTAQQEQRIQALEARNTALEQENARLRDDAAETRARLERLEALVSGTTRP